MSCPNCGSYMSCDCTWSEQRQAIEIRRRREAERRKAVGRPTVVEQERERQFQQITDGLAEIAKARGA